MIQIENRLHSLSIATTLACYLSHYTNEAEMLVKDIYEAAAKALFASLEGKGGEGLGKKE